MIIYLIIGLTSGIIIGSLFATYIVPIIQTYNEIFTYKMADIATTYNISTQKQTLEFYKAYPEAKGEQKQDLSCIGFQVDSSGTETDEECRKIGF